MGIASLSAALLAAGSCGGGGGPTDPIPTPLPPPVTTPSPSPTPVPTNTITITTNGVQPADVRIAVGSRVTFVNQDDRPHDMSSDPHPEHTTCPEINAAGNVFPGQSRQTGAFNSARRCGFHDHGEPDNARLRGSITAQ